MIAIQGFSVTRTDLFLLVIVTFLFRLISFECFIQGDERYKQADSMDYHSSTLGMATGYGMHRIDNGEPIFWRTPGYPAYLAFFYRLYGLRDIQFSPNKSAQHFALFVQIVLDSFIPLIILLLAFVLTQSALIAWITAWIIALHPGFILASNFLLTEGLALPFFFLFLLFFYQSFSTAHAQSRYGSLILAALALAIVTWIRPMGEYVAVVAMILLLIFDQVRISLRCKKIALFFCVFAISIAPWYIRNYQLTGKWFFCPMLGTYLNAFISPRIIRDTHKMDLIKSHQLLQRQAAITAYKKQVAVQSSGKKVLGNDACMAVAWPIICNYPHLALYYWIKEVFKTTFDLYSCQLASIAANTFTWDPIEEFLWEKVTNCLYHQPMPLWMRIIAWVELFYMILLWIGLLGGFCLFWVYTACKRFKVQKYFLEIGLLWLRVAPLAGALIFMTGGFGYARLRLPVEPLLVILSLTFWLAIYRFTRGGDRLRKPLNKVY